MLTGASAPEGAQSDARGVRCVTSLTRGYAPKAGLQEQPYEWADLLDGPAPPRRDSGDGTYVVYHGAEGGTDARVAFATEVRVLHGDLDVVERVVVRRPLLFEAVDWERRWSRRFEARVQARLRQRHVTQSLRARHVPPWLGFHYLRFARWQTRAGIAAASLVVSALAALVAIPEALFAKAEAGFTYLGSGVGRREVLRGLREPSTLSPLGKSVVLGSAVVAVVVTLMLLNSLVALVPGPKVATTWASIYSLLVWGLLSALVLPWPYEANLLLARPLLGTAPALIVAIASKLVGAWMVFFLGDMLNEYLARTAREKPWMGGTIRGLERFARRYGAIAMCGLLSIPFWPETFTLYLFGSLNMPMRPYLLAVAVGMTIRYTVALVGFQVISGFVGGLF